MAIMIEELAAGEVEEEALATWIEGNCAVR